MNSIKEFITNNPQVSASMITAACGILGIFINIFINILFRNRDYKNKNRIQQIETLEIYYAPLYDKVRNLQKSIKNVSVNGEVDLYYILDNRLDAKYASEVEAFKLALQELNEFLNNETYKFFNNYRLYKVFKRIKERSFLLNQFMKSHLRTLDTEMSKEVIIEINELIYRIQIYEIKLLTNNVIYRYIEIIKLWWNYKKIQK